VNGWSLDCVATRGAARFYRRLLRHEVFLLSAAIAYTAILSFFPLLVGLVVLASRWVEQTTAQQAIVRALTPHLPPGVISLVWGTMDAALRARDVAGLVAVFGLFWTATAAASAVRHGLNRVLGVRRPRSFWRRKVVEFVMVVLAGGFMSLSLVLSAVAELLGSLPALAEIARFLERSRTFAFSTEVGPWVLSGVAFLILYRYLPNTRVPLRPLLVGGLTTTVLFEAVKRAFFWYVRVLGQYPLVYSYLAGVVILMVWVYLSALILLVGAEVMRWTDRGPRSAGV
jgi:membrane protein